ncbi:hypothetical protein SLS64_003584 [Diaporthe eres]|uniref:Integral membrane protein n=1 Tax=Diaporthe eres TaxID=83184 RepID=A0ABR1PCF6_DIAER
MLTSVLGLRPPLTNILNPNSFTLTLLPSDSDKSPATPNPSSETPTGAQDGPSLRTLATISILSGTLGLAAMTAVQSLTGYLFLLTLFGPTGARSYMTEFLRADVSALAPEHLAARAAMARAPRYTVFLALFAPLSAALPEELLKYLPALWLGRGKTQRGQEGRRGRQLDKRAAVSAATAASLGFALVELAAYAQAAAATTAGPPMAVTLLERVFVGLPGHVATAVLAASRGADAGYGSGWRDVLGAVAPSVAYHALFDFILFGSSAWVGGHVGWVHPEGVWAIVGTLGACFCVQGVLYAHTARAWLGWGEKPKSE